MSLQPGSSVGPYEIVAPLGAGGMGEVYRARDTRLNRSVAIKVLPASVGDDPDRLARFTREAQTLAALNHPNIAAIYGVEVYDASSRALIMELVEGEDLSVVIARGAMPLAEALSAARQIAEALEAAHEAGVIHRDLKPANIKVRDDGTVKVLDFGLAKALDAAGTASGSGSRPGSQAATMTSPAMTALGMILGTAAYMSPEQAKGRPVDRRADVWAFGVVLYEMLTAGRLFGRDDVSDTLAAVLTVEPDLTRLPVATPVQIRRLLTRCLTKDKRQRLDSMAAARLEIEDAQRAPLAPMVASGRVRVWAVAGAIGFVMFALGWIGSTFLPGRAVAGAGGTSVIVAEVPAPPNVISAFHDGFALSLDGETLVFAARNSSGVRQLWLRRIGGADAQPVAGTEGAVYPFWSPSGSDVAFFSGTKLRRVPAGGGAPQTICDVFGVLPLGSWGVTNEILYATLLGGDRSRVFKVSASGGAPPEPIEAIGEAGRPQWLADGRRFLYVGGQADGHGVRLGSTDATGPGPLVTRLPAGNWAYAYDSAGYLLLNRNDVLTAQQLDPDTGRLIGDVTTIAGMAGTPKAWMAVQASGGRLVGLLARPGEDASDPLARLQWVTRQGAPTDVFGEVGRYWTLALSPDERRVAANQGESIWMIDATRRRTPVTSAAGSDVYAPVWSPSGSALVFRSGAGIARVSLDRDAPVERFAEILGTPRDWSRDGQWLLLGLDSGTSSQSDIWRADMNTGTAQPWLASEASEDHARFSPNGRWVAYVSNSTGQPEVFVRSADGSGKTIPVSTTGGMHPRWRGDGRELYYLAPGDAMMAVGMTLAPDTVTPGEPQRLFTVPLNDIADGFFAPYDVTRDGQRFLLNVPDRPASLFFLHGFGAVGQR
ncbi:MAG: protein kinase [Acidobacteria bacterium]|nr:protein kinase [Acidobacteriota bacterium]